MYVFLGLLTINGEIWKPSNSLIRLCLLCRSDDYEQVDMLTLSLDCFYKGFFFFFLGGGGNGFVGIPIMCECEFNQSNCKSQG